MCTDAQRRTKEGWANATSEKDGVVATTDFEQEMTGTQEVCHGLVAIRMVTDLMSFGNNLSDDFGILIDLFADEEKNGLMVVAA